jgi:hypothetical protein
MNSCNSAPRPTGVTSPAAGSAITNQFDEQARWLGTYLRNNSGTLLNQHLYDYNDLGQRERNGVSGMGSVPNLFNLLD